MSVIRVRQHVNPLAVQFQVPVDPPDWSQVYAVGDRPLHLDIGCAKGRFVLEMAQRCPEWNYLGLEIRKVLVDQSNQLRDQMELKNLHYLFCNANTSADSLLESLPPNVLNRVSIQFPDPWFKKKHHKRRVVQPSLVAAIARYLVPGGEIFIQSDIQDVAIEMRNYLDAHPALGRHYLGDWLQDNPMPVPTEREIGVQQQQGRVYRALFVRLENSTLFG